MSTARPSPLSIASGSSSSATVSESPHKDRQHNKSRTQQQQQQQQQHRSRHQQHHHQHHHHQHHHHGGGGHGNELQSQEGSLSSGRQSVRSTPLSSPSSATSSSSNVHAPSAAIKSPRPVQLPALRIKDMMRSKASSTKGAQPQAWSLSHKQLKNSLILVPTPAEEIDFALSAGQPCVGVLMLQNVSQDEHVAFKVKTTRQKRYLVRPAMGIIEAGSSLSIQFIIPPAEVDHLVEQVKSRPGGGAGTTSSRRKRDKFLVENAVLEKEDLSTQSELKWIAGMWSLPQWKKKIISKKFFARHFEAVVVSSDSDSDDSDDSGSDHSSISEGSETTTTSGRNTIATATRSTVRRASSATPGPTPGRSGGRLSLHAAATAVRAASSWATSTNTHRPTGATSAPSTPLMPPISPTSRGTGGRKKFFDGAIGGGASTALSSASSVPLTRRHYQNRQSQSPKDDHPSGDTVLRHRPVRKRSMSDPEFLVDRSAAVTGRFANIAVGSSASANLHQPNSASSVSSSEDIPSMSSHSAGNSVASLRDANGLGVGLGAHRAPGQQHRQMSPPAGIRLDPMQHPPRARSRSRGAAGTSLQLPTPGTQRQHRRGGSEGGHRFTGFVDGSSDDVLSVGLSSGDSDASIDTDGEQRLRGRARAGTGPGAIHLPAPRRRSRSRGSHTNNHHHQKTYPPNHHDADDEDDEDDGPPSARSEGSGVRYASQRLVVAGLAERRLARTAEQKEQHLSVSVGSRPRLSSMGGDTLDPIALGKRSRASTPEAGALDGVARNDVQPGTHAPPLVRVRSASREARRRREASRERRGVSRERGRQHSRARSGSRENPRQREPSRERVARGSRFGVCHCCELRLRIYERPGAWRICVLLFAKLAFNPLWRFACRACHDGILMVLRNTIS